LNTERSKQAQIPGNSFAQQYLRKSARGNWVFRSCATLAAVVVIIAGYWFLSHAKASGQYIASVQAMSGQAGITRGAQLLQVEVGMLIMDQDTITAAPGASAEIRYAREDTAVTLLSATTAKFSENSEAMQIRLNAGKLACEVAPQPAGRPMRFITPQAVAEVLGTKLSLAVSNAATRLEVTEGSVKLTRNDMASVTVKAGEFAVAASGVELKAESLNRADH
jgi:ferric-dicitrate binding protein FerR (iron transport regulator)